ncbi:MULTISPECIES: hypothetical protein [unclassified Streptomyces]|uniref:hypothetical protein n=1 Tax=unclassified Streptomyces TaxID=2593676 RepID=UPI00380738C8
MSAAPPLPAARAAVFAVVGTVLGIGAHRLLAERPVPWAQGAVAVAVMFAVGLAGVRRPRGLVTVAAWSVPAQSGLHLWLSHTGRAAPPPAVARAAHGHGVHDVHAAWYERLHDSLAMTAAHAVVAALVAVLLHRADGVCWALARGTTAALDAVRGLLVRRPVRPAGPGPATAAVGAAGRDDRLPGHGAPLAHALVRRGPPTGSAPVVRPPRGARPAEPTGGPAHPRAWSDPCPASPCRAARGV